jgi:hypothetical protein
VIEGCSWLSQIPEVCGRFWGVWDVGCGPVFHRGGQCGCLGRSPRHGSVISARRRHGDRAAVRTAHVALPAVKRRPFKKSPARCGGGLPASTRLGGPLGRRASATALGRSRAEGELAEGDLDAGRGLYVFDCSHTSLSLSLSTSSSW